MHVLFGIDMIMIVYIRVIIGAMPMVGGSLQVLRLLPPLKLVAMI
jgi:hypothetical protein